MSNKIKPKEYIPWIIASISIIVNFIQGHKNGQLETTQSRIHTSIQNVQQYTVNNNFNLPPSIKKELNNIAGATGEAVTFNGEPLTYKGEPVTLKE